MQTFVTGGPATMGIPHAPVPAHSQKPPPRLYNPYKIGVARAEASLSLYVNCSQHVRDDDEARHI